MSAEDMLDRAIDGRYPNRPPPKPEVTTDRRPRCNGMKDGRPCRRVLAELVTRPWVIKCGKCKRTNVAEGPVQKH